MNITSAEKTGYLDKSDFRTHLNYARRMALVCRGMTIAMNIRRPKSSLIEQYEHDVRRFAKLSELTSKSIESDWRYCEEDVAYSSICAPWIPVKCYYRLYYLEAIMLLLKGYDSGFKIDGHHKVRSILNAELRSKTIKYTTATDYLGVFEIHSCMNFKLKERSANIKNDFWRDEASTKAVLKLLARYKFENWKRDKNLRTREGQRIRQNFIVQDVSVFDYAYQMRLKANYKDLNFLDPDRISAEEAYSFVQAYQIFYLDYSKSLIEAIKRLYPEAEGFVI